MMIDATIRGTTIIFSALRKRPPKKSKISTSDTPNTVVSASATRLTSRARASATAICQCSGAFMTRDHTFVSSCAITSPFEALRPPTVYTGTRRAHPNDEQRFACQGTVRVPLAHSSVCFLCFRHEQSASESLRSRPRRMETRRARAMWWRPGIPSLMRHIGSAATTALDRDPLWGGAATGPTGAHSPPRCKLIQKARETLVPHGRRADMPGERARTHPAMGDEQGALMRRKARQQPTHRTTSIVIPGRFSI